MKVRPLIRTALVWTIVAGGCMTARTYDVRPTIRYNQAATISILNTDSQLYKQMLDSSVFISVDGTWEDDTCLRHVEGSGVVLDAETGVILTAAHMIINNVSKITIEVDRGFIYTAKEWKVFPKYDLAVLFCEKPMRAKSAVIALTEPKIGDKIIVVGSPQGRDLKNTVSVGILSGKQRNNSMLPKIQLYQTDACIVGGNSGGPWFDKSGCVVGITSLTMDYSGNLGLGISLPDILKVLQENQR